MSTLIVTPLFPPDPSDPARYAKLLTQQLRPSAVIAFGVLPESVDNIPILPISKRTPRIVRALRAFLMIRKQHPETLIVLNGPSSELPSLLYVMLYRPKLLYIMNDHQAATAPGFKKFLKRLLTRNAIATLTLTVSESLPPEWLPDKEPTNADQDSYATWWKDHMTTITSHIHV